MTDLGIDLWGAAFHAITFLCLMAIPWTEGRIKWLVGLIAGGGILTILLFQYFIGVESEDSALGRDLMIVTLSNAVLFFLGSLVVERLFRIYLLKRRQKKEPPTSGS